MALDAIVETVSGVVGNVATSIQSVGSLSNQNSGYSNSNIHCRYCRNIIYGVVQNLQAKLEQIKPLDLTSFSEEPKSFPLEPSAPDSWVTWNAFLRTGGISTNSSIKPVRLEICKFGDIEITLETATIHAAYLVSSHQLRTSSLVFRDLLSPDSEFGEHSRNRRVHSGLTVDTAERYQFKVKKDLDPTALAVVLYIFHAGGKNLSGSIPFAGLVKVAVVCDYYNCSAALGPWYGKWVNHWKNHIVDRGYEDWLLIAWVFGEYQIFQTLTKNLSERGIMENNEFLIVSSEEPRVVERLLEHIPRIIIGMCARLKMIVLSNYIDTYGRMVDSMIAQRNKACETIVQACKDIYEKYNDDTTSKCRSASQTPAGKMCDHCIYGELHMGFKAAKLLTNSNGFNISLDNSPSRVVAELHKLSSVILTLVSCDFGGYQHYGCAVDITGLAQIAQAALNGINQLPLTTFGRNQAERRAVAWDSVLAGAEEGAE